LPWLAPLFLLIAAGVGIWWFVLRDPLESRVEALVAEARTAFDLYEYNRAEELLLQARDMVPPGAQTSGVNVGVHHNLGMLYLQQERWEDARNAFLRAASFCGPAAYEVRGEELYQAAQIDMHLHRFESAEQALEQAIEAHPTRNVLHLALIDAQLAHSKDPAPAESTATRFLRLTGRTPENLRDAARLFYRRKAYPIARDLAMEATQEADSMITAHVIVAKSFWRSGLAEEGLEYLRGPLERHPDELPLWTAHASLLIGAARFDDALRSIDRALSIEPDNYDAHRVRMMALYNAKRYEEAMREAMVCRKLNTDSREVHFLESLMARINTLMQAQDDTPSSAAEGGERSSDP
jgi:tetratricopeptide (TPR) repeat protein